MCHLMLCIMKHGQLNFKNSEMHLNRRITDNWSEMLDWFLVMWFCLILCLQLWLRQHRNETTCLNHYDADTWRKTIWNFTIKPLLKWSIINTRFRLFNCKVCASHWESVCVRFTRTVQRKSSLIRHYHWPTTSRGMLQNHTSQTLTLFVLLTLTHINSENLLFVCFVNIDPY